MSQNTDIEDKLMSFKLELKANERTLFLLEKKTDRLEQSYEHQNEKLDDIENKVNEIGKTIREINDNFCKQTGASETRTKIINNAYMLLTILVALFANDYFFKKLLGG